MEIWTPIVGNVIVAVIALFGSIYGTKKANDSTRQLILYRLDQLETKQDKYNNLVTRTFKLEESESVLEVRVEQLEEQMK